MKDMIEQQREHFNNISGDYDRALSDEKAMLFRRLVYLELFQGTDIEKKFRSRSTIKTLEAMCGFGAGREIIKWLYKGGKLDYSGFDYSDEMILKAREKYPKLNFFQQDITTFETDQQYDLVILLSGIHHVPDNAEMVCQKMYNCLRSGGTFISVEPTYNNILARIISSVTYKFSKFYDNKTERRFSLKELNGYYHRAGFKVEKQIYPGLLAYLLWFFNPYPILLKIGSKKSVKRLFGVERKMYYNGIGRKMSIATFTILRK